MTSSLFPDLFPDIEPTTSVAGEKLSAGQRLTLRQMADVDRGVHPLRKLPTDPDPTHTCSSCVHRIQVLWHNRTYPKCDLTTLAHSTANDCRGWWPGCPDWEAKP